LDQENRIGRATAGSAWFAVSTLGEGESGNLWTLPTAALQHRGGRWEDVQVPASVPLFAHLEAADLRVEARDLIFKLANLTNEGCNLLLLYAELLMLRIYTILRGVTIIATAW